ncbi:hypothetical protein GCG54_00007927 [Colletotrichum gloeosporioides]|uniref:PD-(D/E)XK nuclease-like domain-containing protein n=1 Tax=Colletotrichum gloeosporioides TaxID=474922 RepID=A0A8H4FN15_COLGL|nr:uncharacterized protein GCG54_00007927 [Colletotrichum gloeosporioides]KAF3808145.1 hypothetical protein GCG54_00007927 [Colletotrichum gloeosporioides]
MSLEDNAIAQNPSFAIPTLPVRQSSMTCVDITPSDSSATAFIEAWISQISEVGNAHDVFDKPIDESFEVFNFMTSKTPSPSKKRKANSADAAPDLDATPRPPGTTLFTHRLLATRSLDDSSATTQITSDASSVSDTSDAPSGASSPKKREGELRDTSDHPLQRRNLRERAPTPLMRDLLAIASGPVIPHSVKGRMSRDSDWMNQPQDAWFYPQTTGTHDEAAIENDTYTYMRARRIEKNTTLCKQTMEHEAGWNDMVHSQLLELALADESGVSFRNIVLDDFRETDEFVRNAKVDYAIVLNPDATTTLANSIQSYRQPGPRTHHIVHVNLPDRAATPVTVSIETKSANEKPLSGRVQLATWARAHFRHLERLPSAGVLPILPLVLVHGSTWTVDFAQYTPDNLVSLGYVHLHGISADDVIDCLGWVFLGVVRYCAWMLQDYCLSSEAWKMV